MKILFATFAPFAQGAAGPTSELASARYRVLIPAHGLARLGHQVQLASLPAGGWPKAVVDADCDVLVISKSFHAENEALARAMKGRGKRVVVDLCDDHFAHPERGSHIRKLINLAGVAGVSNNANFALRFQWQFNSVADTGRIDNIHLLSGAVTALTPSIGLGVTSIERSRSWMQRAKRMNPVVW